MQKLMALEAPATNATSSLHARNIEPPRSNAKRKSKKITKRTPSRAGSSNQLTNRPTCRRLSARLPRRSRSRGATCSTCGWSTRSCGTAGWGQRPPLRPGSVRGRHRRGRACGSGSRRSRRRRYPPPPTHDERNDWAPNYRSRLKPALTVMEEEKMPPRPSYSAKISLPLASCFAISRSYSLFPIPSPSPSPFLKPPTAGQGRRRGGRRRGILACRRCELP